MGDRMGGKLADRPRNAMGEFLRGLARSAGIVAGFLPVGMSFGVLALNSDVSLPATVGLSGWLFAGASQFAVLESLLQDLPTWGAILTVIVINLRHVPMSLAAQRNYRRLSRWQQWVLSQGLIDETFAVESVEPPRSFAFYLGLHLACWSAWNLSTVLGYRFGVLLPERWLRFALPGLFLCLLLGTLEGRRSQDTLASALEHNLQNNLDADSTKSVQAVAVRPCQPWVARRSLLLIALGIALTWGLRSLNSIGLLLAILLITLVATITQPKPVSPSINPKELN